VIGVDNYCVITSLEQTIIEADLSVLDLEAIAPGCRVHSLRLGSCAGRRVQDVADAPPKFYIGGATDTFCSPPPNIYTPSITIFK